MTNAEVKIGHVEWDNSAYEVKIKIPGLVFEALVDKLVADPAYSLWDHDADPKDNARDACWVGFQPNYGYGRGPVGPNVSIARGDIPEITVSGGFSFDDPDDGLDGMAIPKELSLGDRLEVAAVIKKLIAE